MSRLQPQIDQSNAALQQQMANQGITPGSEAYNNAMRVQQQGNNDLVTQAALQGINLDMGANQQGYGQALNTAQFGNQAIGNSLQEQLALRNQPLNEITGLMSGSQIQMPQFQQYQGSTIAPSPIFAAAQAQGQNAMNNYGIQSANANATNSGLYNLAGTVGTAALMFSDRRLKTNIVHIGDHPLGFGIYEYDIFGKRQCGVMADEVEKIIPQAVIIHSSGFKMVDYSCLTRS